jgi:hypothetical protein
MALVAVLGTTVLADGPSFEREIAPLLARRCLECHNASDRKGELTLSSEEGLRRGGESGPIVVAGDLDQSLLWTHVRDGLMPPPKGDVSERLAETELETLRRWMEAGSPWPAGRTLGLYETTTDKRAGRDWWSLQPPMRKPPKFDEIGAARDPIDVYVLNRLRVGGLTAAPEADRRMLLRRLSHDLVGVPPTYEELEAFAAAEEADAYERWTDRLLASPHFGERWARYWLDLVRYADTSGYERDQEKPGVWKYRDWVVDAINSDMPYDRFVAEQLAGDELDDRSESSVIATGFLRLGTWNDEPNDPLEYKYERVEDLVHTTSTAFLGMTVKCARCHDHKFDPIPQVDYYRMGAVFWAGHVEPRDGKWLGGPTYEELGYEVFGYTDRARDPPAMRLLRGGDPHREEGEIAPGFLSLSSFAAEEMMPPPAEAKTSHRRRQLAAWILDRRHPLTARVAVNRLWQHHFGAGLVRTPDNFGFNGDRPTHPELLDAMALDLMEGDWRQRDLHRRMVTSATYRQASTHPQSAAVVEKDPSNLLWARGERRRRDAESLRDAMLRISGELDDALGGPSFRPTISGEALEGLSMKEGAWSASPAREQRRRSLYMFSKRSLLSPLMTVMDFCDTSQPCAKRDVTTVAPQALALLNNEFVHRMSRAAAEAVLRESGQDVVGGAWRRCLARDPSPGERRSAGEHLRVMTSRYDGDALRATASLCHVLLNVNEFAYVD